MEEESDVENRNPDPEIDTKDLSDYKFIFPSKPAKKPSRKEETEARKCRRSGMVPGAIRKYLIQKKQHERDEEELEEDVSASTSPSSDDSNVNNNKEPNAVGAACQGQVEEDDEIHFLGEYSQPENNILAELNQIPEEGNRAESKDVENAPLDSETEFEEDEEIEKLRDSAAEGSNKRRYSEVFSPDSTTPLDTLRVSPEKQSRLERTPSTRKHRPGSVINGNGSESPVPGTSGGGDDEEVIRNRKGVVIGSHVRNIFALTTTPSTPSVSLIKDEDKLKLEGFIGKNNWKAVIGELRRNLANHKRPEPSHLGDFVKKAILTLGTRVSKDIPAKAVDFFKQLVVEYPVGSDDSLEYYITAFTHTSPDATPAGFLFVVLSTMENEAKSNVTPTALPFFKSLTKMAVNQYKEYITTHVRLRRPFFVRFLEERDKVMSYNIYCQKLLQSMFALKDFPNECKAVMRWVGLLADHLRRNTQLDTHFYTLVCDFVNTVSRPELMVSRISLIQSISEKILGAAVCLQLLRKSVTFKIITTDSVPTDEDVVTFLRSISQSELIAGLKSGLKERRRSDDVTPILIPKLKKSKKEGVNMKGESFLHRLCRKASGEHKNTFGLELDKFLREKRFPVNPKDHFGNTPLHDAIAHERFDALTKFYEYCSEPSLPEDLRVDILAQNDAGETPLHLAAISASCDEKVEVLRFIADKLQVTDEALKLLNLEGKMPYQLAYTPKARGLLKPGSVRELPYEVGNVRVDIPSRTELQSIDCKRLIALWSEFSSE